MLEKLCIQHQKTSLFKTLEMEPKLLYQEEEACKPVPPHLKEFWCFEKQKIHFSGKFQLGTILCFSQESLSFHLSLMISILIIIRFQFCEDTKIHHQ